MNYIDKGATFSEDKKYRFDLYRRIGLGNRKMLSVGLNPSTAGANKDDPTIRRDIGFALTWGFDLFYKGNLWPYVTSNPKDLTPETCNRHDVKNQSFLVKMAMESELVVLSYGNHGDMYGQGNKIASLLKQYCENVMCFGKNQNGQPKHELYLPKTAKLERWE
jgi:hypothetical protein